MSTFASESGTPYGHSAESPVQKVKPRFPIVFNAVGIIERFGHYHRTIGPGLGGWMVPLVDRLRAVVWTGENVQALPAIRAITDDAGAVIVDATVHHQVVDPRAAVYEIDEVVDALEKLTITALRNIVGGMIVEQALESRKLISSQMIDNMNEHSHRWGLQINRVELRIVESEPAGSVP